MRNATIIYTILLSFSLLLELNAQDCGNGVLTNLIENGDFGQGSDNIGMPSSGSFSPLIYTDQVPPALGSFTIANNTTTWEGFAATDWVNTGDNSLNPNGYMMVIHQDGIGSVYETTFSLCSGVEYTFSFDAINLFQSTAGSDTLTQLQLLINNDVVAEFDTLSKNAIWQNLSYSFVAEGGGAEFRISTSTNSPAINSFALDNISLSTCAPLLTLVEMDARGRCPGDNLVFDLSNSNAGEGTFFYQLQVSINEGTSWINIGNRTSDTQFIVNNLPPNAQYRVIAATSEENLFNTSCRFTSNIHLIQYADPATCNEVVETIGELCEGSRGDNIFEDGDFGSGASNVVFTDPRLAPGYAYQRNPPPNDGFYTITNSTAPWGSFAADTWINIGDNSPDPNGYMMVVNASVNPGIFYTRTVPVCENTNYEFSADVISVNQTRFASQFIEPNISFLINGVEIFESGDVPIDGEWHTYGFTFTTRAGVNAIELTLRNNAPGGLGNDLALDNISFRPCGPQAVVRDTTPICVGTQTELVADISLREEFPELAMQWQRSVNQGQSWIDIPGEMDTILNLDDPRNGDWYRLKLANRESNLGSFTCQIFSNISVLQDDSAGSSLQEVICEGNEVLVDGMAFDSTGSYEIAIPQTVGCDSIVSLQLQVNPRFDLVEERSICESETFVFGNQIINASGVYNEAFQTVQGCDSLVELNLVVEPEYEFIDTTILCFGEAFEGRIYFEDEIITEYLTSVAGCDSLLSTYFRILPSQNQTFTREVCPGDSFNGTEVNNDTLVSVGGFNGITCDSVTLYQLELYEDPDPEIKGTDLICGQDTIGLSVSDEFRTWQWSTGATGNSISVSSAGTYSVEMVSSNDCIYRDEISIEQVNLSASFIANNISCTNERDGQISIANISGGMAPYLVSVNNQAAEENFVFDGLFAGDYTVRLEEANGCFITRNLQIIEPDPFEISLPADTEIKLGEEIPLSVEGNRTASNFRWSPREFLSCTDCPDPIARPFQSLLYQVIAQDSSGCESSASIFVTVDKNRRIFVPNAFSPNQDRINDDFRLYAGDNVERIEKFTITDRWGNRIKEVLDVDPDDSILEWDGTFKGQKMSSAVFLWTATVRFIDGEVKTLSGDVSLLR